jgi:cytochrome P450
MGKVLAEHPDQRSELVKDRTRIPTAIEELLRYEPPGPHVARYVLERTGRITTCELHRFGTPWLALRWHRIYPPIIRRRS